MFIRGDYRELAEIALVMLGGFLPGGKMNWKKPGAIHKARFMALGICGLKLFTFSNDEAVKAKCFSSVDKITS